MEDYYRILEMPPNATDEKLKESYKRLALRVHPDKNPSPNAIAEFQRLSRAWETLKDPGKRRTYDIQRENEANRKRGEAEAAQRARQAAFVAEQQWRRQEAQREAEAAAWRKQQEERNARENEQRSWDFAARAREGAERRTNEGKKKKVEQQIKAAAKKARKAANKAKLAEEQRAKVAKEAETKRKEADIIRKEAEIEQKEAEITRKEEELKRKEEELAKNATWPGANKRKSDAQETPLRCGSGFIPSFSSAPRQESTNQTFFPRPPTNLTLPKSKPPPAFEGTPPVKKLLAWKQVTANEYEARVHKWSSSRRTIILKMMDIELGIKRLEVLVGDYNGMIETCAEVNMNYYLRQLQSESRTIVSQNLREMAQKMAVESLSRHEGVNATTQLHELKFTLDGFREQLSNEKAMFEKEEYIQRQQKATEAQKFLPPVNLFPHRSSRPVPQSEEKHRAIWKALEEIRPGWKFKSMVSGDLGEGPWHETYVLDNNHKAMCGRCNGNMIKFDGRKPARCKFCDIVVCNNCHTDLELLREYAAWLAGRKSDSLFQATEEIRLIIEL